MFRTLEKAAVVFNGDGLADAKPDGGVRTLLGRTHIVLHFLVEVRQSIAKG